MSNRYKIINNYNQKEWIKDCPVKIEKIQLLLDTKENKIVLQLKMYNISLKNIKSIYLDVECFDDALDYVSLKENIAYQNINAEPKNTFGDRIPVFLDSLNISFVKVIFKTVVFNDDEIWRNNTKSIGILLPEQNCIEKDDVYYNTILNEFENKSYKPRYWPEFNEEYWRCCCGQTNSNESLKCCYCGIEKKYIKEHLNIGYLENAKKELEIKNNQVLKEIEKQKNIKKKRLKLFAWVSSIFLITTICIAIAIKLYMNEPLSDLVKSENKSKITILLKLGKDINETNIENDGETALTMAIKKKNKDMVNFLIKNNANINEANESNEKPLEIALKNKYDDIADILIEKGAEASITEEKTVDICIFTQELLYSDYRKTTSPKEARVVTKYSNGTKTIKIYIDNVRYEGDFVDGTITGKGTLYNNETNKVIYTGYWKNGLYEGSGSIFWSRYDQVYAAGTFKNGNLIKYTRYYMDGSLNDKGTIEENGIIHSDKNGVYTN